MKLALGMRLVLALFGMGILAFGIRTMWRREARLSHSEDSGYHLMVTGLPAVLLGAAEIALGFYLIFVGGLG
jgi:hypothetical protein